MKKHYQSTLSLDIKLIQTIKYKKEGKKKRLEEDVYTIELSDKVNSMFRAAIFKNDPHMMQPLKLKMSKQ